MRTAAVRRDTKETQIRVKLDLDGKGVHQGIAVYGNKGSTDQHSYIQQLREGVPNFFATFIEVLKDREGESIEVEPGTTSGDYLLGFLLGTREALYEKGRQSVTVTVDAVLSAIDGSSIDTWIVRPDWPTTAAVSGSGAAACIQIVTSSGRQCCSGMSMRQKPLAKRFSSRVCSSSGAQKPDRTIGPPRFHHTSR